MERPILDIKLTPWDWVLEILALVVVISTIVVAVHTYRYRPVFDTQFHYKKHQADAKSLVGIACLGCLMYAGLTGLSTIPQNFKYPVVITAENAEREYRASARLLRTVKLFVLVLFLLIAFSMAQSVLKIYHSPFTIH